MDVLARPLLLVGRPGQAFLRHWPLAVTGDVEAIHQARVATRRLREALPLIQRGARDPELRRVRRALRDLTRALGPSRELDVSRLVVAGIGERLPGHRAAAAAVDGRLAVERAKAAEALRAVSERLDVAPLIARTRDLARRVETRPAGMAGCAHRASARLTARARALQKAVVGAGRVYAAGPLHAVRIALKKFRYSFELAAQLRRAHHGGSLRRLKALQDVLGDMHDLQVLAAHVRDAEMAVPAKQRPAVAALVGYLDEQIRDLHSRYVTQRELLVAVLSRARRLGESLAAVTPPTAARRGRARALKAPSVGTARRAADEAAPQTARRRPGRPSRRGSR